MTELKSLPLLLQLPQRFSLSIARQQEHLLQLPAGTLHSNIGGGSSQRTYKKSALDLKKHTSSNRRPEPAGAVEELPQEVQHTPVAISISLARAFAMSRAP